MFQVVHPVGLLALSAMAVPIVLHLRRRPLTTVRVGSLRSLGLDRHPDRWLQFRDLLRLILRCAVLGALTLCLAGLHWSLREPRAVKWCLVIPGTEWTKSDKTEWAKLQNEGYEPRWLERGFPRVHDGAIDHRSASGADPELDVWSLLREADLQLPADSRAVVFGPTWASQFRGTRPVLRDLEVHWFPVSNRPPDSPLRQPARVGVVASPDRSIDAQYVRAALAALGASQVSNETPEWIFQLGDTPLPPTWTHLPRPALHLVRDAPEHSEPQAVARQIDVGSTRPALLRQRVAAGPGIPLCRDSQGEPWLTEERGAMGVTWHVAFRFHPDWSDWPMDSSFPAWWLERLHRPAPVTTAIAPEQAAPRYRPHSDEQTIETWQTSVDLRGASWLMGAALFLAERALNLVRRRSK